MSHDETISNCQPLTSIEVMERVENKTQAEWYNSMRCTSSIKAPVVSFLSSRLSLSRRSQETFHALFALEPVTLSTNVDNDEMNQLFASHIPGLSLEWDSLASKCHSSGTVLHFISIKSPKLSSKDDTLSLLSITDNGDAKSDQDSIKSARDNIATHMKHGPYGYITRLSLAQAIGRSITPADILALGGGLPLLQLCNLAPKGSNPASNNNLNFNKGLKEIALPVYDDARYRDGSTLLSKLSSSLLTRPTIGLFQFPNNGVSLRPLPAATEDRLLPAPSLVFYCPNLEEAKTRLSTIGVTTAKIGFRGTSKQGQLMVVHKDIPGLDIRLTENLDCISSFFETQEALLAGSLDDLQNINVLVEGGKVSKARQDTMTGLGDCWVEFRANLKKPSGFLKRNPTSTDQRPKIAKAPDIPYE